MQPTLRPQLEQTLEIITGSFRKQFEAFEDRQIRHRGGSDRHGTVRFSRAIQAMMGDHGLHDGPEHEFFSEIARARGESLDPHRIILPLTCLKRDLNVAQATAGGFLVGVDVGEAQDVLRPWSVIISGGVTVEEQLTGNVTIPKTLTGTSITWQPTEASHS